MRITPAECLDRTCPLIAGDDPTEGVWINGESPALTGRAVPPEVAGRVDPATEAPIYLSPGTLLDLVVEHFTAEEIDAARALRP